MDDIKALHTSTGPSINKILFPTCKIFTPLLLKNEASILSIPKTTESYGVHPRQKLDIYLPVTSASVKTEKSLPVLLFVYGGGLVAGDKIMPDFMIPKGLVYHNLGAFFAKRGFRVVIPDYRRVNSERGGEDAVFPSGGEDISLVLKWIEKYTSKSQCDEEKTNLFMMGNSAGGLHMCTFLFEEMFLEQRRELISGSKGLLLKGFISLSVPYHFRSMGNDKGSREIRERYYGSIGDMTSKCPYGLFVAIVKSGRSRKELAIPRTLVLLDEFDPQDEIVGSVEDFVGLWETEWGQDGLAFEVIKGQNHISPPLALMSGEGEEWAEDILRWMKGFGV